ncbi:MAG: hypothetical protein LBI03_07535 [Clostridiales bacterium]|jgi:hypothetical protein|nr:hypothetical protein [Clostridiales bacterium]
MHKDWCGKRPCGECRTSCAVDESMPCSPDCERLDKNGIITDYRKCLESGCDVIQLKELQLYKKTVDYWQRLVDMTQVDFEKENIDRDCMLKVWSVEFDDGYVADLRVCSGNNNLFLDAILFRPCNGGLTEESVLDCPDNITDDHVFNSGEGRVGYVMRISMKTE